MKIISNAFADLPQDVIDQYFQKAQKCKISWKVDFVNKLPEKTNNTEICYYDLNINLSNNFNVKSALWIWVCPHDNEYYDFDNFYKPLPKVWENIYAIIDKENNQILKYWKSDFEKYSEISMCETEENFKYDYYYWFLLILLILFTLFFYLKKKNKI